MMDDDDDDGSDCSALSSLSTIMIIFIYDHPYYVSFYLTFHPSILSHIIDFDGWMDGYDDQSTNLSIHSFYPFIPSMHVCIGGVSLRPGDGIIHSWLNRMLLPDTLGTGGDSHTRFPIGRMMMMMSMMMVIIMSMMMIIKLRV